MSCIERLDDRCPLALDGGIEELRLFTLVVMASNDFRRQAVGNQTVGTNARFVFAETFAVGKRYASVVPDFVLPQGHDRHIRVVRKASEVRNIDQQLAGRYAGKAPALTGPERPPLLLVIALK